MTEQIQFRQARFELSKHAQDRLRERFSYDLNLQDALHRGKMVNMQNVSKWPWQKKSFYNTINTNVKFIVNEYYNLKAVIDVVTKVIITFEYLDARHTSYRYKEWV